MKAERAVKRITFYRTEASPGETLYVTVPNLNENEVQVPGSLALRFDIDLSGGHAEHAIVDKLVVRGTILQDTVGYDIYKIFEDLFLSQEKRDGMIFEGIQSEDLCKIRSGAGDKKTSGVDAENKLNAIFGKRYRINLDHQILTDHGVFYLQALYNYLVFELTLAPPSQVVKGSDSTKLKYKLTNIQLQYEMIRDETLTNAAKSVYNNGKELAYDYVTRSQVVPINKGTETRINIKVDAQRRSLKAIPLSVHGGVHRGSQRFRKIHLPRSNESQRHDQRLAQHDIQQRHRRQGHVGRGPPLLCERKK